MTVPKNAVAAIVSVLLLFGQPGCGQSACGQAKKSGTESSALEASPGETDKKPPGKRDASVNKETAPMKWTTKELVELGVRVDFVADRIVRESNVDNTRYSMQPGQDVSLGVIRGPKATLAIWAAGLKSLGEATVTPPTPTTLCGASAQRQVASVGPHAGRGSRIDPKTGTVVHLEPEQRDDTVIAIEVDLPKEKLLVTFRVENSKRESLKAVESHFFASVKCI